MRKRYTGLAGHLGKAISSDVIYFSFGKSLLLGYQMVDRSSQGLMLSLDVSCELSSLFLGVWQCKGWLAVADKVPSSEVKESLSGCIFSSRWNFQVAKCDD